MLIQGPLTIHAEEIEGEIGFLLRIGFREEFQGLDLGERVQELARYLGELHAQTTSCAENDPNRQGMLIVLQVGEQLLPMIREDSLPLTEEIEIRINQKMSLTALYSMEGNTIN